MKKLVYFLSIGLSLSLSLVACQNRDNDERKTEEMSAARQSYDRCVQTRGQEACNVQRSSTIMSLKEYYASSTGTMYGANYGAAYPYSYGAAGLQAGANGVYGVQLTFQQVDNYFTNYLGRASREEIASMANQWASMSYGAFGTGMVQPMYGTGLMQPMYAQPIYGPGSGLVGNCTVNIYGQRVCQ